MRERYGVDAPKVILAFGALSVVVTAAVLPLAAVVRGWFGRPAGAVARWLLTAYAAVCWGMWCWSVYGTVRGKRRLWVRLLDRLHLTGTERVLELGPGRGAVLVEAARRVPRGHAVGIDLWRTQDQTGNTPERLLANAAAAGVADRVRVITGDMRSLPFEAGSFDLVVASLALHNLPSGDQRTAVEEAVRVLAPGGRIVVLDYRDTGHHADLLRTVGAREVVHSGRSWRLYPPVRVVQAKSPQVRQGSEPVETVTAQADAAANQSRPSR
jgi:arsenite methyltransferase